jgi:hypothetical protein
MEWNLKRPKNYSADCQCEDGFLLLSFAGGPLVMLRIFKASEISPGFLVSNVLLYLDRSYQSYLFGIFLIGYAISAGGSSGQSDKFSVIR